MSCPSKHRRRKVGGKPLNNPNWSSWVQKGFMFMPLSLLLFPALPVKFILSFIFVLFHLFIPPLIECVSNFRKCKSSSPLAKISTLETAIPSPLQSFGYLVTPDGTSPKSFPFILYTHLVRSHAECLSRGGKTCQGDWMNYHHIQASYWCEKRH